MMFAIGDREWAGLSKLAEEAGEVLQVVGRLMATHGDATHWSGMDLRLALMEELADLSAALVFVQGEAFSDEERDRMHQRASEKLRLFQRWHREHLALALPERSEDCERHHLVTAAEARSP